MCVCLCEGARVRVCVLVCVFLCVSLCLWCVGVVCVVSVSVYVCSHSYVVSEDVCVCV